MENERFDYIVLDAENAIYADNFASWDVADYMFKQFEKEDEIFISLHSCDYTIPLTTPTTHNTKILIDYVELINQESTNREDILSIVNNNILFRTPTYYISPNNNGHTHNNLNTSKFYKIKLSVSYDNSSVDISNSYYAFILKVSYKKKN